MTASRSTCRASPTSTTSRSAAVRQHVGHRIVLAPTRPLWPANPTRVWNPRELASYGLGRGAHRRAGLTFSTRTPATCCSDSRSSVIGGTSAAELFEQYVTEPLGLEQPCSRRLAAAAGRARARSSGPRVAAGSTESWTASNRSMSPRSRPASATPTRAWSRRSPISVATRRRWPPGLCSRATRAFRPAAARDPVHPPWYNADGGALLVGSLVGQYGAVPGYLTATFADPDSGLTVASCSTTPPPATESPHPRVGTRGHRVEGARHRGRDRAGGGSAVDGSAVPRAIASVAICAPAGDRRP